MSTIEAQEDFTPPLLITKAMNYIRENIANDLTRDEVARHAGISPSHFSRLLKERTGRSFTDLLRQCRVDLACELLRDPDLSLAEIAPACGFCDQSYFTRVFKETKGVTPGQFRERLGVNGAESSRNLPVSEMTNRAPKRLSEKSAIEASFDA